MSPIVVGKRGDAGLGTMSSRRRSLYSQETHGKHEQQGRDMKALRRRQEFGGRWIGTIEIGDDLPQVFDSHIRLGLGFDELFLPNDDIHVKCFHQDDVSIH
jgi:hypothetical protein